MSSEIVILVAAFIAGIIGLAVLVRREFPQLASGRIRTGCRTPLEWDSSDPLFLKIPATHSFFGRGVRDIPFSKGLKTCLARSAFSPKNIPIGPTPMVETSRWLKSPSVRSWVCSYSNPHHRIGHSWSGSWPEQSAGRLLSGTALTHYF